jgi:hypothetical protein
MITRIAAIAFSGVQACRTTGAAQMVTAATTELRTRPFLGIVIDAVAQNATASVIEYGPVHPDISALSPGVACAVGTNVNGEPVRSTDPGCVSAPNWLGDCDASGTITIRPRCEPYLNVLDFGAIPDCDLDGNGTPCADAIQAAIRALAAFGAGTVYFPAGYTQTGANGDKAFGYRIEKTIEVDRAVACVGASGQPEYGLSAAYIDAGVTGFRVHSFASGGGGGADTIFRNLKFFATGRNEATKTCSCTTGRATITNVETPNDFVNGQLALIRSGGHEAPFNPTVTAACTQNSPTVTITDGAEGNPPCGIRVGDFIKIATAFPNPTRVVAINGSTTKVSGATLTMASNAAAQLVAGAVTYYLPRIGMIVSGGGTSTITLDGSDNADTTLAATTIEHADAAIHLLARAHIFDCAFGDNFNARGFQGYDIVINASHAYSPASNANSWTLFNTHHYGSPVSDPPLLGSRGALYLCGSDANAGVAHGMRIANVREWGIVVASNLTNTFIACEVAAAPIVEHSAPSSHTWIGLYREGGTPVHFGPGTTNVGGATPLQPGGFSWAGGIFNHAQIGQCWGASAFSSHRMVFEPAQGFFDLGYSIGTDPDQKEVPLSFRALDASEATVTRTWFGFLSGRSLCGGGLYFSYPQTDGAPRSELWLPDGFKLGGRTANNTLKESDARDWKVGYEVPTTGMHSTGEVILNPNNFYGPLLLLKCCDSGAPGSWARLELPSWGTLVVKGTSKTLTIDDAAYLASELEITGNLTAAFTLNYTENGSVFERWIWNKTAQTLNVKMLNSPAIVAIAPGMAATVAALGSLGTEMRRKTADIAP